LLGGSNPEFPAKLDLSSPAIDKQFPFTKLEFSAAGKSVAVATSADFTIQLLDGTTLDRSQAIEGVRRDLESILGIDPDRTYTRIECLTLSGKEATVYTYQQYTRTIPDRKDGSPHEATTSVRHIETWIYTKDGWVAKRIKETEQGPTFLDGEVYDPR